MFRDTMISTMPVAMIAIEAVWIERFHRFRAVMKVPPETMLKPIQMIASAAIIPSRRVSISVADRRRLNGRSRSTIVRGGAADASAIGGLTRGRGDERPAPRSRRRASSLPVTSVALRAGVHRAGLHTRAELLLRHDLGVDDLLEVVLLDGRRVEDVRRERVPTGCVELDRVRQRREVRVGAERDRGLARGLAQRPAV